MPEERDAGQQEVDLRVLADGGQDAQREPDEMPSISAVPVRINEALEPAADLVGDGRAVHRAVAQLPLQGVRSQLT